MKLTWCLPVAFSACVTNPLAQDKMLSDQDLFGTPSLASISPPIDMKLAKIGRKLFFDKRLSVDQDKACSSCHQPENAYADGKNHNLFLQGRSFPRNTPSLINVAWSRFLYWDGRANSLAVQVRQALQGHQEMGPQDLSSVEARVGKSANEVVDALVEYQRTILSYGSPFDQFLKGGKSFLSEKAQRGLQLFRNKADCARCHKGPHFTDNEFHNTGVPGDDPGRASSDRFGKRELAVKPYPFLQQHLPLRHRP